jgi:hypothetical protein
MFDPPMERPDRYGDYLIAKAKALNELTNALIIVAAAVALIFVWTP